jgi:Ca2+/Na+ antiporter
MYDADELPVRVYRKALHLTRTFAMRYRQHELMMLMIVQLHAICLMMHMPIWQSTDKLVWACACACAMCKSMYEHEHKTKNGTEHEHMYEHKNKHEYDYVSCEHHLACSQPLYACIACLKHSCVGIAACTFDMACQFLPHGEPRRVAACLCFRSTRIPIALRLRSADGLTLVVREPMIPLALMWCLEWCEQSNPSYKYPLSLAIVSWLRLM